MSELAAQTSLTPSGLTRSVDRLQEQGLVARRVCPEDRRGAFAVLTPAGQELMDRAIPDHIAHVDEVLSNLFTAEEEEALAALLRKLRDHLYDANAEWGLTHEDTDVCPGPTDVGRAGRTAPAGGPRVQAVSSSDWAAARTRVSSRLPSTD